MPPRRTARTKQRSKAARLKSRPRPSDGRIAPGSKIKANSADRQIPIRARDRLAGEWFAKLVALQAKLRGPGGCPWDGEQTHESLRKFLIEETYEVLDAMDSGDSASFCGELGDLLLQVIFHSILAEEAGRFTISDAVESVHSKMVRRHPHVFGGASPKTSADVLRNWEQIKAAERTASPSAQSGTSGTARESILGGVPRSLPAVLEAYQLTRRASHVGFDWENLAGIFDKLAEEGRELQIALGQNAESPRRPSAHVEEEAGDLLFSAVNVARFLGVDPEIALKKANRKFKDRFQRMEAAAERECRSFADLSRTRKEELWNSLKAAEIAKHLRGASSR